MRTWLWLTGLMIAVAGCADDGPVQEDAGDADPPAGGLEDEPGDEEAEASFQPTYINGTLSQNLADCSDPSDLVAGGASHDLPDGAGGRSYSVTIVEAGEVPVDSVCVAFDTGSASMSGTVPDDATSILIGGDLAVGTQYSIHIE